MRADVSGGVKERRENRQISQGCKMDAEPPRAFKKLYLLIFREMGKEGERKGEKH